VYEVEGEFRDLILTASYKKKGIVGLDRGTLTQIAKNDGRLLSGCFAWYEKDDIISGTYRLHRLPSQS